MSQYILLEDKSQDDWEDVYEEIYDTKDESKVAINVVNFDFTYIDSESQE